jgi:hypothetical protein
LEFKVRAQQLRKTICFSQLPAGYRPAKVKNFSWGIFTVFQGISFAGDDDHEEK